jgi:Zn-dependent peptidase ImmA (M78 family)
MAYDIIKRAAKLIRQCGSRSPFCIAKEIGIDVYYKDLGKLKGMYTCIKRNRFIVINENLNKNMQIVVCAHELGHDQFHRELAINSWLQEFMLYDMSSRPEYEANLFASEILLSDDEILELIELNYDVEQISRALYSDINLIALKIAILTQKGYSLKQFKHHSNFLK